MVERDSQLGEVRDLTPELREKSSEAIREVLEVARIRMFEARFDDALSPLDSVGALPIHEHAAAEVRARLLLLKAEVLIYQALFANSGHDAVLEPLEQAEALASELGDKRLSADATALRCWSVVYRHLGATPYETLVPAQRSLDLRREIEDQAGTAESLFLVGLVNEQNTDRAEGNRAEAEERYREALSITEPIGEKRWRSYATRHLGFICLNRGDLDDALELLEESLRLREEIGLKVFVAPAYHAVGVAHLERGELDEAVSYCQRAYDLATELGMHRFRFIAVLAIGEAHEKRGDAQAALASYRQGLGIAESVGADAWIASAREAIESVGSPE